MPLQHRLELHEALIEGVTELFPGWVGFGVRHGRTKMLEVENVSGEVGNVSGEVGNRSGEVGNGSVEV